MSTDALLDASAAATRFGASVSRISEWHRDRATTGFPEVADIDGRRRLWNAADLEAWFTRRAATADGPDLGEDPGELLGAPQVAALLGVKSVHAYLARPGYFPEPDSTEHTERYVKRFWRRETIVAWAARRPGRGNTKPKAPHSTPVPNKPGSAGHEALVDSAEAARLLGYASTASFASAFAQGNLGELGEPEGVREAPGRGRPSRLWSRARVEQSASRRRSEELVRRRREEACRAALQAAGGAPVSARTLFDADPEAGTLQQWKASLDGVRRQLKAAP
ncbi:hypothetical protein [Streptacidiphilus rugosus]|uniref:hypothetical protein n=1 Tax=Streptacidiphilus rugosus TaxID=405783 RepID=UPI00068CCC34|nr:hypothetical protein [Streptacidiphilus rugosus]